MRRAAFLSLLFLLLSATAWAQVTSGQITGTVSDASGAVVPNATITATNPATGFTRSTASGKTGSYNISQVPPGMYDVKIEAPGFSTVVQKNVNLAVGQVSTLNFQLKPGAASEVVNVTEEAPLIETTRSEIGGSVSPVEVKELPIVDRNFASLTMLVPGVRPAESYDPTKTRVGTTSVNGGDGRQYDYNVDGGDNKDNVVGGLVQNFSMEGIQEFNVVTNRYGADQGRTVGGVVNVITKSGTNALHGTLFGQFQNSALNKRSFFTRDAGPDNKLGTSDDITSCPPACKPNYKRYHFGGSVGGPLIKDRAFFFGAYEHKRELVKVSADPTAFRELSLLAPLGLTAPTPQISTPYFDHLGTAKVDIRVTDKQNMFLRYGRQRWTTANDQQPNTGPDPSEANTNVNNFHDLAFQHNYAMSGTKVNALNLHFQDMVNQILGAPGRTFTIPIAGGGVATNPNIIFPSAEFGNNVNVPQETLIRKWQIRDDINWSHNRHNMRFGANWIYLSKMGGFFFFGANGYQITFEKDPSQLLASGGLSQPGVVSDLTFSGGNGFFNQRPHELALYFQDDFKLSSRLTLNLGVRWDANIDFLPQQLGASPEFSNRGVLHLEQVIAANPGSPEAQIGVARARQIVTNPDDLRRTTSGWKHFQPRIGFAWDPAGNGKAVIRGGYGIAFDQLFQNLTLFSLQQSHPNIYGTPLELTTADLNAIGFTFSPTTPLPAVPAGAAVDDIPPGGLAFIVNPRARDPFAQQMSLGFSWQFAGNWAVSVDGYHVLGLSEPRILNMNPQIRNLCDATFPGANPADPRCVRGAGTRLLDAAFLQAGVPELRLGEVRFTDTNNRSRFDSVNFQLRKRFGGRVTLQTSYVLSWSRSWGGRPTASYGGTGQRVTPEEQFAPGEFNYTNFDERHRLVFSGVFTLPGGIEFAPIFQASSPRPFNFRAGTDINGDGANNREDRACVGSTAGNPVITPGCGMVVINGLRGDSFYQLDARIGKNFKLGERATMRFYWEGFNLFNRNNFCNNFNDNASSSSFLQPQGYCGDTAFSRGFSGPMRSQVGFRFEF